MKWLILNLFLFIVIILLINDVIFYKFLKKNEYYTTSSEYNEAVQNIASLYNNEGTLVVPSLHVTGETILSGNTEISSGTLTGTWMSPAAANNTGGVGTDQYGNLHFFGGTSGNNWCVISQTGGNLIEVPAGGGPYITGDLTIFGGLTAEGSININSGNGFVSTLSNSTNVDGSAVGNALEISPNIFTSGTMITNVLRSNHSYGW